jgi:hypothetical protein
MIELPDPKRTPTPTQMDKLAMGADCAIHPLLGCVIANNGTAPEQQARNYLISVRQTTIHQIAGRAGDLSEAEFRDLLHQLEQWEKTNSVKMPGPIYPAGYRAPPLATAKPNTDNHLSPEVFERLTAPKKHHPTIINPGTSSKH